jgi:hypothetical protein
VVVTLVSGPPCAGKTWHVQQHAGPDDVVLDADVMGRGAFERAVKGIRDARAPRVWVIRCLSGPARRAAYRAELGADEHVHLVPDTATLLERARRRPDPARHVAAVRQWVAQETGRAPVPCPADPSPSVSGWWA